MAVRLLKKIQNHLCENPECDSIIFHSFSNGGGFILSNILALISTEVLLYFLSCTFNYCR